MNFNFVDFQIQSDSPALHGRQHIADSTAKTQILDQYRDITDLLDKMNNNIQKIFKKKEEQLISYYKEEMDQAQERLKELAELTSDAQLKRKVQQKKEEIEAERQKILQSSMEFSNRCKEYKERLLQVMNTTKDLEAEIKFLDDQIAFAAKSNVKLKNQLNRIPTQQSSERKLQPLVVADMPPKQSTLVSLDGEIAKAKKELEKRKFILQQLESIQNDSSLELNQLEKIFLDCVQKVKSLKQQSQVKNLLMQAKRPRERPEVQEFRLQHGIKSIRFKQEMQRVEDLQHNQFMEEQVQRQDHFFSDIDLNDGHRRMILEEFLSRTEVKMLIYNLLFRNGKLALV